jgi:DNA-binding CsgD family transcriptional regulator
MRLSHRDFDALQHAILELYAHREADAFRQAVPGIFLRLVPAAYFSFVESRVDLRARRVRITDTWDCPAVPKPPDDAKLQREIFLHPFTQYAIRKGVMNAVRLSDFMSLPELKASRLWRNLLAVPDFGRMIGVGSYSGPGISMLSANRHTGDRDFSGRDVTVLNLVRPHFDQARRHADGKASRRVAPGLPIESFGFTPREAEIARWLSRGKSNPEIATVLRMRVRTVEKHVERILGKLGVENRATAAVIVSNSLGD